MKLVQLELHHTIVICMAIISLAGIWAAFTIPEETKSKPTVTYVTNDLSSRLEAGNIVNDKESRNLPHYNFKEDIGIYYRVEVELYGEKETVLVSRDLYQKLEGKK